MKIAGRETGRIGLGCMGMTWAYGASDRDEAESIATIHRALDLGVTLLDTADMYGPFTNELLVGKVRELAEAKGCTPGQLALAWVLAQGDDVAPIPGTKRVTYLEENVGAADVELTTEDLTALEQAVPRDAVQGDRYGSMASIDA